jgi:hypothetical protein
MAFHLLELGVEEGDLFDKVVVALERRPCVSVDTDSISDVKWTD